MSGAKIGKNTMISLGAKIDVRRGYVTIGNNCLITHGCYILSHDGAAHILNKNDDGSGYVTIGNNVFIGVNTVVMRNVTIGDHAIIGAGSVVNKDVPEGVVAAGNPIKILKEVPKPYKDLPKKH
jgi:acetyltransferase-like isoleucine patch superfamily enzyme